MPINLLQILGTYLFNKGAESAIKNLSKNPLPIRQRFSKEPIRVSISYLHRIAIKDDKDITWYLLVKNKRVDMFQAPGGVYKYKNKQILEKIGAKDDKFFHEKGDFRLRLPRRNIQALLKAFADESWREVGYHREFKEELLDTNILPFDLFDCPEYRPIERRNSGLRWSDHFQCEEITFYDIIEVVLTKKQKKHLRKMLEKPLQGKYVFATEESIIREGFSLIENFDKVRISEHSKRIL